MQIDRNIYTSLKRKTHLARTGYKDIQNSSERKSVTGSIYDPARFSVTGKGKNRLNSIRSAGYTSVMSTHFWHEKKQKVLFRHGHIRCIVFYTHIFFSQVNSSTGFWQNRSAISRQFLRRQSKKKRKRLLRVLQGYGILHKFPALRGVGTSNTIQ